jgi:hypothetical protein
VSLGRCQKLALGESRKEIAGLSLEEKKKKKGRKRLGLPQTG